MRNRLIRLGRGQERRSVRPQYQDIGPAGSAPFEDSTRLLLPLTPDILDSPHRDATSAAYSLAAISVRPRALARLGRSNAPVLSAQNDNFPATVKILDPVFEMLEHHAMPAAIAA